MTNSQQPLTARQGLAYGLLGLPLAFVALPLYVLLPHHYAQAYAMPLATLGALLLGARLLDAAIDPLLGRFSDRLFAHSLRAVWTAGRWQRWRWCWDWRRCSMPWTSTPSWPAGAMR